MENEESKISENTENKSRIAFVFGVFMVIIYCGMGMLFIFSDIFAWQMPETARIILGTLFVLYGIYRGYRIIKK